VPSQLQPVGTPEALARRAKGYSIFDEDLATTSVNHALTLLPNGLDQTPDDLPASATVRETGTTDEMLSKSFQSDNDVFLERDWCRPLSVPESTSAVGSSALDHVFPHVGDESAEAFDLYGMPPARKYSHRQSALYLHPKREPGGGGQAQTRNGARQPMAPSSARASTLMPKSSTSHASHCWVFLPWRLSTASTPLRLAFKYRQPQMAMVMAPVPPLQQPVVVRRASSRDLRCARLRRRLRSGKHYSVRWVDRPMAASSGCPA